MISKVNKKNKAIRLKSIHIKIWFLKKKSKSHKNSFHMLWSKKKRKTYSKKQFKIKSKVKLIYLLLKES
jgi:hypothetical protein